MLKALFIAAAINVCSGSSKADETDAIKSLNEVENLQIVGDIITIASKNGTHSNVTDSDAFDEYLQSHVIRIKAPFAPGEYFDVELGDLLPDTLAEGRKKRRTGLRDILIPLLLAIKHKFTVVLPLFMMFITVLALKGVWAGVTGMFISKLVALKVFLQSQDKANDDHEEDQQDDHDDHNSGSQNGDEEDHEDDEEPVVIFLHSDKHGGKFSRRRQFLIRRYQNPKNWNPWKMR